MIHQDRAAFLYQSLTFDKDEDENEDNYDICIKKKTSLRTISLLETEKSEDEVGIHSSLINGHILVLLLIRNVT